MLLQTFQTYKMRSLVAVVWINRFMMLVIVANCWFVPLTHIVLRNMPSAHIKILMLIFDSLMNAVYAMVMPFAIFYLYYIQYDPKL